MSALHTQAWLRRDPHQLFHLLLECCILFWLLVSQWVIINTVSDSEIHDNWSQRVWSRGICAFSWRIHRRDIDRVYTWIRYRYNDLRFLFLPKMKMLPPSWFKKIFWGICFCPYTESHWCPKQQIQWLLKYFLLCSTEKRKSYMFGTTWGWVNDDIIFIFGLTIL